MHDNGFRYSCGYEDGNEIKIVMYNCDKQFFVDELYEMLNKVVPIRKIKKDIKMNMLYEFE